MTEPIFEQVRNLVSDLFGIPAREIRESSSPQSIDAWDSTQHLNLVLALEGKFQLELLPEEIDGMKSVGDVVRIVETKLQAANR
ncbi:MAG: acyl carrier protein [Acidobacteria bacterium]|nr:acyl carrier protein [Acidobacteriota bacterium]